MLQLSNSKTLKIVLHFVFLVNSDKKAFIKVSIVMFKSLFTRVRNFVRTYFPFSIYTEAKFWTFFSVFHICCPLNVPFIRPFWDKIGNFCHSRGKVHLFSKLQLHSKYICGITYEIWKLYMYYMRSKFWIFYLLQYDLCTLLKSQT